MNKVSRRLGDLFINSEAWPYLVLIFFISYVQVQVSADLNATSFFAWILILSLIYLPIILYGYAKSKIRLTSKWKSIVLWLFVFLILPVLTFIICSKSPLAKIIDPFVNYHFVKNSDEIYLVTSPFFAILYFLLKVSKRRDYRSAYLSWIKKMSFFKIAIFGVLLLAFILPLISSNFQSLAIENTRSTMLLKYAFFVPQIFIIYFSYYLFYFINHHFLFLRILEQKGIIYYIVGILGLIFTLTPLLTILISLLPVVSQLKIHPIGAGISIFDVTNFLFPLLVTLLSFPIIAVIEWNKKELALKELQQQKTKAELSLLKQQINPHFFFNTLNNLYALSLEHAKETPDTILKLSQLMRFVIYKGQQNSVSISEEIAYIKDYIDLQKIRFKQTIDIKFETAIDDVEKAIPPLLLINLVENAFKHGVEPSEHDGYIHMQLSLLKGELEFVCRNSVDTEATVSKSDGMGLKNLQRRLEIIYPDSFEIVTKLDGDEYISTLKITL